MSNREIIVSGLAAVMVLAMGTASLAQRGGIGALSDKMTRSDGANFNPSDPRDPLSRAMKAFDAGDFKTAQVLLEDVLSTSGEDANLRVVYGMSMVGTGNLKSGLREFDRALRLDRGNLDAHRERGLVLARLGDGKEAGKVLARLKSEQSACGPGCPNADKLKRAVAAVEAALGAPPAKGG